MDLIIQQDPNTILRTFETERRNTIFNWSPLILAIISDQNNMIEFLIDHAPKLLEKELWETRFKISPLLYAIAKNAELVDIILSKAPQLWEQYSQEQNLNTLLIEAAKVNKKDTVKLLLEKVPPELKRELFLPNNDNQGPLHNNGKKDIDIFKIILGDVPPDLKGNLFLPDILGNTPLI